MAGMTKTPRTFQTQTPSTPPRDFRQEVTDKIIALLEKGVAPWQKPWDATGLALMPMNHVSKKPYRGGNALHLMITAMDRGYDDPRWMTYKQAADNKGQVGRARRGRRSSFGRSSPAPAKPSRPRRPAAEESSEETERAGRPSSFTGSTRCSTPARSTACRRWRGSSPSPLR